MPVEASTESRTHGTQHGSCVSPTTVPMRIITTKKAMVSDIPTRPSGQNGQSLAGFDIIEGAEDACDHFQQIIGSSNRVNKDELVQAIYYVTHVSFVSTILATESVKHQLWFVSTPHS